MPNCLLRGGGKPVFSHREVEKDNSKLEPKNLRKIQIHQYGQKICYKGYGLAEFLAQFWASSAPASSKLMAF